MKINLAGLTSVLNSAGGIYKAKKEEQDSEEAKALNERRMQVAERGEEDQRIAENARASEAMQRLGLERDQGELANRQFEFAKGEAERKTAEQHLNEAAARSEYKRLYGKEPELGMDLNTLHDEIITRMTGDQRVKEIKAQHDYDQSKQLELATRQMSIQQSNLNTLRRYKTDTVNSIMMDKSVSKEDKMGVLSGDPAVSSRVFLAKTGRDLDAEINSAAKAVQMVSAQAFTLTGNPYPGQSPLAQKAIQDAMPYAYKTPEQQMAIAADLQAKAKAGQPIDVRAAAAAGVPIGKILGEQGYAIDENGQVMKGQSAVAKPGVAVTPGTPNTASIGGMPTLAQAMSNSLTTDNAATNPAQLGQMFSSGGSSGTFGGNHGSSGTLGSPPAPAAPSVAPSSATPPAATPGMFQNPPQVSGPGVLPPAAAMGNSQIVGGMGQVARSGIEGITPQGPANVLQRSNSLPEAEYAARQMLNSGADYDQVISSAPARFQPMLAAKLPKRVPQSPAGPGPSPQPLNAPPIFSAPAAQIPVGSTSLSGSRPLFSPPSY